jgi:hypothetical protein
MSLRLSLDKLNHIPPATPLADPLPPPLSPSTPHPVRTTIFKPEYLKYQKKNQAREKGICNKCSQNGTPAVRCGCKSGICF